MNRRTFTLSVFGTSLLPKAISASQPQATPDAERAHPDQSIDPRTRDLTRVLQSISPVSLIESLERAQVNSETLIAAAGAVEPVSTPWADYSDTDLLSSLGGVILASGDTSLYDPDAQTLGGYIVYESAEIAYHEFTRKLGNTYDNPSITSAVAGTNVWMIESDNLQIGTWRIGYVMMMAMISEMQYSVVDGIIEHLAEVADSVVAG